MYSEKQIELFWKRVSKKDSGCWEWTGSIRTDGYGCFWSKKFNKHFKAHRWSYQFLVRELKKEEFIDHLCRNTKCVNPDHLDPVSNGENILRGIGYAAKNARKTHCPKGHEYIEANIYHEYFRKKKHRLCRICTSARNKKAGAIARQLK